MTPLEWLTCLAALGVFGSAGALLWTRSLASRVDSLDESVTSSAAAPPPAQQSDEARDDLQREEAREAADSLVRGLLEDLREHSRPAGGRLHLHDVEVILNRRRARGNKP